MAAAALILLAPAVQAQTIDQTVANQTNIVQRFSAPRAPGTIDIAVPELSRRIPSGEADKIHFKLRSLTVDGAVTVPDGALALVWQDRIGSVISVADLYEIAAGIDEAYRRAGYFSMTVVPDQDFGDGHIVMVLYESYVSEVVVQSDIPGLETRLAPYIQRIVAMRPIRIREAERILLLMSDLAGIRIEGTFKRPDTPTAGGSLLLEIATARFSNVLVLDNMGSKQTGPVQLTAIASLNDVFGRFEASGLVGMTVPNSPDELLFIQASQDFPIGHDGLHLGYRVGHISSHPGGELRAADVEVRAFVGGFYLSYPFLRTIGESLFGRVELSFKNSRVDVGPALHSLDRDRWLTASLRYLAGFENGSASLIGSFGQGLDAFGATSSSDPVSRTGVSGDYRFFRIDVSLSQEFIPDTTADFRLAAQYAPQALPSAVRLDIGGDPFGRAFDGSTASGDSGIAVSLEVSRAFVLSIPQLSNTNAFAFVDYGALWSHDVGAEYTRAQLGSAGVGLRTRIADKVNSQLLVAIPFHDEPALSRVGTRVFLQFAVQF